MSRRKKVNIEGNQKEYRKKLDKECNVLAREICFIIYKYKCQKPGCASNNKVLQPHHIFTREHWHIKWDWRNLLPLHPGCHRFWAHKYPDQTYALMEKLLGKEEWDKLVLKKNTGLFKRSIQNLEFMKQKLECDLERLKSAN
jgi:hypothetical protein